MEAVNIGISTDNYLVPTKIVKIEHRYLLVLASLDLNAAAYDFYKICDYLVLENLIIVSFQTVEYLSSHRDNSLKLCISCHFYRTERRVALHDIKLTLRKVF